MTWSRVLVCGVLVFAAARPAGAGDAPFAAREVQALTYSTTENGLTVQLKTSSPVPPFRCVVSGAAARGEIVLEIPEATSRLEARYALEGDLVSEVRVESGVGATGVRVRFILDGGGLSGVEQTGQGLLLRFVRGSAMGALGRDPSEYRIGIGDKLEISVFGHEDLNRTVDVRGDGAIGYPLIGDLRVAGRTPAQVVEEITRSLGKDYLVDPQVSVEVKESQSQWVTILGEVRNPGKYLLRRNMRVIDLLAESGGATKDAGSRISITHRDTQDSEPQQIVVDRDSLFGPDNPQANMTLAAGDIVTIGEKDVFYIRGEVSKPGPYFLERDMTILKAITFAGGLSQFANRKEISLLRTEGNRVQQKLNVNLKAIESGKAPDVPLLPGDLIIVPRRIF